MRTDEIIFKNRSKSNKFRMVTTLIKTISKARIRALIRDRDKLIPSVQKGLQQGESADLGDH
ncbi:hypothetical protein LIQ14_19250, partial [Phocaeicola vulgatus]|nr:hypothetical protein [Phocaeicola vulgatus]